MFRISILFTFLEFIQQRFSDIRLPCSYYRPLPKVWEPRAVSYFSPKNTRKEFSLIIDTIPRSRKRWTLSMTEDVVRVVRPSPKAPWWEFLEFTQTSYGLVRSVQLREDFSDLCFQPSNPETTSPVLKRQRTPVSTKPLQRTPVSTSPVLRWNVPPFLRSNNGHLVPNHYPPSLTTYQGDDHLVSDFSPPVGPLTPHSEFRTLNYNLYRGYYPTSFLGILTELTYWKR